MLRKSIDDSDLLRRNFPFESRWCTIDGRRMHYIDEGSGPVVLMLHGNPTWSFMYRSLIAELKSDHRVIAPDYIGCGLSDHPRERSYRAIERVAHVEALLEQIGVTRFSLVLHDWGGSIGSMLAARAPERVGKLVYLNTTLTEIESLPEIIKRAAAPVIGKILTKYSMSFLRLLVEVGVAKRLPSEIRQCYLLPYRSAADRQAIWDFVADIPFTSEHPSHADMVLLGEKLPLLAQKPVQIVWGLKDPCFHREMLSKVAAHFPHAHVLELPNASHLLLEDAPDQAVPVIRAFLDKESEAEETTLPQPRANALYEAFRRHADAAPDASAVIVPSYSSERPAYTTTSFRQLSALVDQYSRGFHGLGLEKGDKILFLVQPGVEFLALVYASMARGAVPVLVDPGVGKEKLLKCIEDCKPQAFVGSPAAFALRLLRPRVFNSMKFHLAAVDLPIPFAKSLRYLRRFSTAPEEPISSDGTALIAFTSGATGTPKGVIFSNENIDAQLEIFRDAFGLEAQRKCLSLLPAFSLFNLAAGIGSVFAPLDQTKPLSLDPEMIVNLIESLRVDYSFGSPTLWRKITDFCLRTSHTLPSVKSVFMAGAPVPKKLLEDLQSLLPNGEAFTPYGATEALPVTLAHSSILKGVEEAVALGGERGTLVGTCVPGVTLRIIRISDKPLADISEAEYCKAREIGEVIVKGRNVSGAYLYRPDANVKSKIRDGNDSWHRMGDVGYVDEQGNIYFCGRKAHAVNVSGRFFYPVPCERIFNCHPKVRRSALIEIGDKGVPGIAVEPIEGAWPESSDARKRFAAELRRLGEADPVSAEIRHFIFFQDFPVDGRHNAKIYRDQLSQLAGHPKAELIRV